MLTRDSAFAAPQVATRDFDDHGSSADNNDSPASPHPHQQHQHQPIPSSPPPSFHSRASSPASARHAFLSSHDPLASDADRTLADTFDDSDDDDEADDRQRLMRGQRSSSSSGHDGGRGDSSGAVVGGSPGSSSSAGGGENGAGANAAGRTAVGADPRPGEIVRRVTQLPVFAPRGRTYGRGTSANDGVFANLSAKPAVGEIEDEKPPSYEQAAADATPPYWETTILAPGTLSDEVFVDGLPVGSIFSFIWNAMISMSFQIVGFLLTYLLHTTHAAKNGSRAGLGITLIQYGFSMKGALSDPMPSSSGGGGSGSGSDAGSSADYAGAPPDPNSHDFNMGSMMDNGGSSGGGDDGNSGGGISSNDLLAYGLMVIGWFILIRAVSDFVRARKHEQLVLQSPDRGLSVPVVAEGERPESAV
ncbi:hypothetical protein BDY21DRAFT_370343 [Lineolata rhizophorae]|uniref:Metal homeostatis protein bsd2 n=1 Tax=Lineolata rhizophorae TaxID=578093 RepID=A0A6A6P7C6_9PEZI|nr:hypothetical protein BDY21DRAFT_370343 [Lineolata rhizophorae]